MLTMMICFQLMQLKQDSSYSQVFICFSHFLTPHRFLHVSTYFICFWLHVFNFFNSCNHCLHRRGHAGMHAIPAINAMHPILEHTHVPGAEKLTCVGSWETGCVDRNWAGGNLGTLVPSRFGQLVSQLLLACSEYLEYLRH